MTNISPERAKRNAEARQIVESVFGKSSVPSPIVPSSANPKGSSTMSDQARDVVGQTLRMDAYYYGFEPTGVLPIDRILSAVACAGKSFHHTEDWNDSAGDWGGKGDTPVEWIQNAANEAALALRASTPVGREHTLVAAGIAQEMLEALEAINEIVDQVLSGTESKDMGYARIIDAISNTTQKARTLRASTPVSETVAWQVKPLVDYLWQEFCELPDRSSPEEYPDMALVSLPELTTIVETFAERAAPAHPVEPVAWLHTIVEPDGQIQKVFSHEEKNPFSHWLQSHRDKCVYKVKPLYAHPIEKEGVSDGLAQKIVSELFADLRDRRFLKWLFKEEEGVIGDFPQLRSIDLDVQEEIAQDWTRIVANALAHNSQEGTE